MKFSTKAILVTSFFIGLYMILSIVQNPHEPFSYQWRKDIELSFSAITSIGALFWSMYAVYKYSNFVNVENLIIGIIKDITHFKKELKGFVKGMKKFTKLFNKLGIIEMLTPDKKPDTQAIKDKYQGGGNPLKKKQP